MITEHVPAKLPTIGSPDTPLGDQRFEASKGGLVADAQSIRWMGAMSTGAETQAVADSAEMTGDGTHGTGG
jgi:hypothetical protein